MALAAAPPAAAAATPVPCNRDGSVTVAGSGYGKHWCSWWRPGNGASGGSIVVRDGNVVGYLHQGRNWIVCQQKGGTVHNGDGNRNYWYDEVSRSARSRRTESSTSSTPLPPKVSGKSLFSW